MDNLTTLWLFYFGKSFNKRERASISWITYAQSRTCIYYLAISMFQSIDQKLFYVVKQITFDSISLLIRWTPDPKITGSSVIYEMVLFTFLSKALTTKNFVIPKPWSEAFILSLCKTSVSPLSTDVSAIKPT